MKILIVRLSSIGDCVLASPVIEALRERYPDAHLTWAVQSKSVAVVRGLPNLDETLLWDDRHNRIPSLMSALWRTRRAHFDVTLDLQGLDKAGLFLWAGRSPRRVSGSSARRIVHWKGNELIDEPRQTIHAREFYLRRASQLDIAPDALQRFFPRVPITSLHRRFANEFLAHAGFDENHRIIGLNLGASRANKRWAPESFAKLADTMLREDEATRIVVFGAPSDAPFLEQFETELAVLAAARRQMGANGLIAPGDAWRGRVLVAVGNVNLLQLAALSERCAAFITGDTGPMHIAAAVGAPIVALFGPTSPSGAGPVQKPDGASVRVLDGRKITGLPKAPMETHSVQNVLEAAHDLMSAPVVARPPIEYSNSVATVAGAANSVVAAPTSKASANSNGNLSNGANANGANTNGKAKRGAKTSNDAPENAKIDAPPRAFQARS